MCVYLCVFGETRKTYLLGDTIGEAESFRVEGRGKGTQREEPDLDWRPFFPWLLFPQ